MPPVAVTRRLIREISSLKNQPPEGIRIVTNEEDMLDVVGIIAGPSGTPYEGGYFRVKFQFTDEFPAAPPKCRMMTKIFHPNVSSSGEICVNTLKKDWQSTYGIAHILVTVKCLLIYPNPESALDEEAGRELLEDYESYCSRARLITSVHATPKTPPPEFDVPSVESSEAIVAATSTSAAPPSKSTASSTSSTTSSTTLAPPPASDSTSSENNPSLLSASVKPRSKSTSPAVQPIQTPLQSATNAIVANGPHVVSNVAALKGTSSSTGVNKTEAVVTKTLKRPAAGHGAENRKKALKRL
ncbi:hypothetical protein SISNIDRAFT_461673 [Sistotremastrum niveocremeum HHB9708]|uniref:E2 ubiquitin-conjugating enzyme n=1 Tax=Sistotremastrum niveocremeum HHB9708 TaxID=1314777 RepID=A0A164M8G3_9AGAM|nr:hypothetical protein SISNIDRAFT_461673 [Sistotremastrum niveocremeum HHB9708]